MSRYEYPYKICEYCPWTNYGEEPYRDGMPIGTCEGYACKSAAKSYEEETGKKWKWENV